MPAALVLFIFSACATPSASLTPAVVSATQTPTVIQYVAPTAEPTALPTLPVTSGPGDCKVLDTIMPVIPEEYKPTIPLIDEKQDWFLGNIDAPVIIIEYSDYQCPYCQYMSSTMDKFIKEHSNDIGFAYRHFVIPQHDKSFLAAQASEAAGLQGKFWEMHNFLFEKTNWDLWILMTQDEFKTYLEEKAVPAVSGLDKAKFMKDFAGKEISDKITKSQDDLYALANDSRNGLQGTPTFFVFVKGQVYNAPPLATVFENMINLSKLDDQRIKECPPMTVDSQKNYQATIKTEKGDIVIKLFPDKAQTAVNSFIYLAKKGYYNGVAFHRVIEGFIAQTGDPSNSGMGGPGYVLDTEITEDMNFDRSGLVGMIHGEEVNTNNSQFFITLNAIPDLSRRYTLFGEVVSGLGVVEELTPRDVNSEENPAPGDKIISITIEEK